MPKLMLFLLILMPFRAFSYEFGGGLSLVEESDDRLRIGFNAHVQSFGYEANIYTFGRHFGPVRENSYLLSLGNYFSLPLFSDLYGSIGGAFLSEQTVLEFDSSDREHNLTQDQKNLGLFLSLKWVRTFSEKLYWRLTWDSAVFPAGFSGGILLATGRKQFLSAQAGYIL